MGGDTRTIILRGNTSLYSVTKMYHHFLKSLNGNNFN